MSFEVSVCEAGKRFRGCLCSRRKDARLFHGSSGRPLEKCHAIVKRFMLHCPKSARQCFQKLARSLDRTRKSLPRFMEIHFSCYSVLFRIMNSTVYVQASLLSHEKRCNINDDQVRQTCSIKIRLINNFISK